MNYIWDKVLFLLRISPLTVYQFALGGVIFTRRKGVHTIPTWTHRRRNY